MKVEGLGNSDCKVSRLPRPTGPLACNLRKRKRSAELDRRTKDRDYTEGRRWKNTPSADNNSSTSIARHVLGEVLKDDLAKVFNLPIAVRGRKLASGD